MKKRIFAMLMAAAMMLSMAACGNGAEEKKTETKKFPRKRSETHLIFSKTHNPLPFTLTTSENLTKPNGDTKTHINTPNKNRIKPKNERKPQKP